MNELVELKDNPLIRWKGLCDNYARAVTIDDKDFIKMFEGFFTDSGIRTASPQFFKAIADGNYKDNTTGDGVVVSHPNDDDTWMWCDCEEPSEETTFWADGAHPLCGKHCYTCKKCNKLLQVG